MGILLVISIGSDRFIEQRC